ncbi:MAG: M20/M25/M40 family metallo-hydrolase [Planctomycetota bacterium]
MILLGGALLPSPAMAWERAHLTALESIASDELLAHIEVLAADAYEGRSSGSRGGRAAAAYLVEQLEKRGVAGGAPDGGYYQSLQGGRRNVLAKVPGTDPELADEWIVLGAHYDHVGYGNRRTSFGPIGYIHNGADDNASGVAALLELVEALSANKVELRRSLLIAFWDGEEIGMIGSQHWARHPTVPLRQVKLAVNIDMIGRLREGRLELLGSRTGFGLRKLASVAVDPGLWVDFTWEMEPNSDHWTFVSRGVPTLMLHTGLHGDYHRPSDDVERLNIEGIRSVGRYLFDLTTAAADAPELPTYRARGRDESPKLQAQQERPLEPLPAGTPTPRVGISWREDRAEAGTVFLTRVAKGSPAESAGLQVHDRLLAIDGQPFRNTVDFEQRLQALLAENADEILLLTERRGRVEPRVIHPN